MRKEKKKKKKKQTKKDTFVVFLYDILIVRQYEKIYLSIVEGCELSYLSANIPLVDGYDYMLITY